MAKSPAEMLESMKQNLKQNTGKDLDGWKKIVIESGLNKHGQIVKFFKSEHHITHGYANMIAHEALQSHAGASNEEDLVSLQYSGEKQPLYSIYEDIIGKLKSDLPNLEIAPKKAYVSLRHRKQFAIIQPSTKNRIDVGINLDVTSTTDRLEKSGSFNSMVSHRVRLSDRNEVDTELLSWLKTAYDQAG